MTEPKSIDQVIDRLLEICSTESTIPELINSSDALNALHSRLSGGELHIAIIGQFNRGKSTFINRLLEIDLLPMSVLPLTAIPTEIRFGSSPRLEIVFQTETKVFSDEDAIVEALVQYVTEGENPENRLKVEAVKLFASSELLEHGTTIIDTPGFGSTHIHNTKATLQILKDCDAALFMLSADLPITQMELNFIKQIAPQVSRLFFVYNKQDLLSSEELVVTTNFIRETIEKQLKLSTEGRFFPVSAKRAMISREGSGLNVIEKEVVDFLHHEKYFSLAEAIQSKLATITAKMIDQISKQKSTIQDIITEKESEVSSIQEREEESVEKLSAFRDMLKREMPAFDEVDSILSDVETVLRDELKQLPKINHDTIREISQHSLYSIVEECGTLYQSILLKEFNTLKKYIDEPITPEPLSVTKIGRAVTLFETSKLKTRFRLRAQIENSINESIIVGSEESCEKLKETLRSIASEVRDRAVYPLIDGVEENLKDIQSELQSSKAELASRKEANSDTLSHLVDLTEEIQTF